MHYTHARTHALTHVSCILWHYSQSLCMIKISLHSSHNLSNLKRPSWGVLSYAALAREDKNLVLDITQSLSYDCDVWVGLGCLA